MGPGYGLSQIRVKQFTDILSNQTYSTINEEHENTVIIKKSLNQILDVTDGLYGGSFHFLQATYALFFGRLIQLVQALLSWKRIKVSDVTTFYQQAADLLSL